MQLVWGICNTLLHVDLAQLVLDLLQKFTRTYASDGHLTFHGGTSLGVDSVSFVLRVDASFADRGVRGGLIDQGGASSRPPRVSEPRVEERLAVFADIAGTRTEFVGP